MTNLDKQERDYRNGASARKAFVTYPKLLIVEDDPFLRVLLKETLQDEQHTIMVAADGTEALQVARQQKPEVVLLDLSPLARPSGVTVCRLLKADDGTAHLRVILMSAAGSYIEQRVASAAGADHVVVKPFSPLDLRRRVEECLGWGNASPRPATPLNGNSPH